MAKNCCAHLPTTFTPTLPLGLPRSCSDVICEFPLKDMLLFHKEKGCEATILVTKVRPYVWTCVLISG